MDDISKKFGQRILELRKLKGYTQSELAEMIDVEVVTISRIENGSRFPKKETLQNIANVFNVEIKELFDFEHFQSQTNLIKYIQEMISFADTKDLMYIYKFLKIYFEAK